MNTKKTLPDLRAGRRQINAQFKTASTATEQAALEHSHFGQAPQAEGRDRCLDAEPVAARRCPAIGRERERRQDLHSGPRPLALPLERRPKGSPRR
jgi:hypothetical protein